MADSLIDEEFMVPLLQRLVRHPSEQTDLQEEDPGVKAFIADCAALEIDALGLGAGRYDAMGNLILELGPADTGKSILFATYAMTHQAARMTDPFAATVIDTPAGPAVRGRGSVLGGYSSSSSMLLRARTGATQIGKVASGGALQACAARVIVNGIGALTRSPITSP